MNKPRHPFIRSSLTAFFVLTVCSLSALAAEPTAVAPAPKQAFHLYLLIGQSNMAGRGAIEEQDKQPHPRVLKFTADKTWVSAVDPLHFDKPAIAGVGLGSAFGRAMTEAEPGVTIGLVPCAVGGTPLARWLKGRDLYEQALPRIKAAMKDGTLKGVLWHQGESDATQQEHAETYAKRLAGMVRDLRAELGVPEVPFVAGKLGEFLPETKKDAPYHWRTVNAQLAELPKVVPKVAVVESTGLKHKGDEVHFDAPSLRELGRRYAEAMRKLQGTASPAKAGVSAVNADELAKGLLALTPEAAARLEAAKARGLIELAPVHLPANPPGDCDHYGWPIATMTGDTIVVMHRRIPGHNAKGAGEPNEQMSYGVVLRSEDGGKTWSEPYDLRDCMKPEDRNRGGLVPLFHRPKFDPKNKSTEGYMVHLHAIGPARDGAVVAINNHGVFRSEDAGRTWRHFSTALRDDTFAHPIVILGPRLLDHPQHGLLAFGNWTGKGYGEANKQLIVLNSRDGGATWGVEQQPSDFPQYEPAAILHDGRCLLVTRDQTNVRGKTGKPCAHWQMRWSPGEKPQAITTNLEDPRFIDTVDFSFNPVTKRFEVVRSERHRMELWLWSMDPADWEKGQWRRECRLLARDGKFYATADGFHPAGAVLDEKRGVQHLFIYSGHPNGPAGVFRLTRTLDTPKLGASLRAGAFK